MASTNLSPSEVVAVGKRCSCYGSDCKPVADGQHKAYCNKATKTQRFINSLQQFEVAIEALYGTLYKEEMLYYDANSAAKRLEKTRDKSVADWNDDLQEGEQAVVRCIKADGEPLDRCDQYLPYQAPVPCQPALVEGRPPLCEKCQERRDREEERAFAERGI